MRKRFELQYSIGQKRIEDVTVDQKSRDAFPKLIIALKKLYVTPEINDKVFSILEGKLLKGKAKTGRTGMDLWTLFVLAQARLCLNISYDRLHDLANNHSTFRQIMGIETDYTVKKVTIAYQNIIDNVSLLDDVSMQKINDVIVAMGHEVFKKKELVSGYLEKAQLFVQKIKNGRDSLSIIDEADLIKHLDLDYFLGMLDKHIDLLQRRVIKDETIPHGEKIFSIFETYTEWITKGKQHPNVELGKNVQITTDQFHLIIDCKVMENEVDKSTVISLSDRILSRYKVRSWSYDKGFYTKENKELAGLFIENLIMPKKGKLNKTEREEEQKPAFKKLRGKHNAIESNINELESKGLDKCPDKGYRNFKRYIMLGVCAYNLHRIGAELLRQEKHDLKKAA